MEILIIISRIVWTLVGVTIIGGTIYSLRLSKRFYGDIYKTNLNEEEEA